jgi:hypothetical protein
VEEQVCGIYPFDKRDLPTELEELRGHMVEIEEDCVAEAKKQATLVGETSKALVDLGLPTIREIPHVPRKAQEVLKVAGVILEHL